MKAPDKLFIKPGQIKVEMIPGGELPNVGIQYIRKDALLEWLEERNKEINGLSKALWRSLEIKALYDKLNSM